MYSSVGDNFDHAVSYPWVTYLFTGMTPDEVQKLATASHTYWANYGRYAEETWTSPIEQPGQSGVLSVSFVTGLTFTDELLDLYHTLMANGIDVYIVSHLRLILCLQQARSWAMTYRKITSLQCATSSTRTAFTSMSIITTGAAKASTRRRRDPARARSSCTEV